jgi:DNA invertase Pin-like site-specific DNA recombinase
VRCPVVVAKLDRLSRDVHFISGLMAHRVPFVVTELGPDVDPFVLHLYAALAEKESALISGRTKSALAAAKARGVSSGTHTARLRAAKLSRRLRLKPIARPALASWAPSRTRSRARAIVWKRRRNESRPIRMFG